MILVTCLHKVTINYSILFHHQLLNHHILYVVSIL